MKPGDTRTWSTESKTYTLTRTDRPYAYDLCDAYNKARTRDDLEFYVDPNGNVKMGTPEAFTKRHTEAIQRRHEQERDQWKRAQSRADQP